MLIALIVDIDHVLCAQEEEHAVNGSMWLRFVAGQVCQACANAHKKKSIVFFHHVLRGLALFCLR